MRILHVSDRVSLRGGADLYLRALVAGQAPNHRLRVLTGRLDPDADLPCPIQQIPGLDARDDTPADPTGAVADFNPDVIHIHNVVNPRALQSLAGPTTLMTIQDHRCFCPGRGKWTLRGEVCQKSMSAEACAECFDDTAYFEATLALTRRRLDAIRHLQLTVLSEYMKQELVLVGVPQSAITVIPPFVHDLPHPQTSGTRDCVLYVGRLVRAKGVYDALEAWRRSQVDLPLVFAGTGSERAGLEAAGCRVLGWLDRPSLAHWYARAAVVIMPSLWQEPFGIVGLEAQSFGAPVVAYDSGGISEWLPEDSRVPWGDIDAMATAIQSHVGRTAKVPGGFDPSACLAQVESVYRRLIEARN